MQRLRISITVITTLFILGIISVMIIQYKCNEMIKITENIESALNDKNTVLAITEMDKFDEYWVKCYKFSSLIAKRDKVSDITLSSVRLRSFVEADSDEATAELSNLIQMIEILYKCELPSWVNIF